jgi:hypothetical protein
MNGSGSSCTLKAGSDEVKAGVVTGASVVVLTVVWASVVVVVVVGASDVVEVVLILLLMKFDLGPELTGAAAAGAALVAVCCLGRVGVNPGLLLRCWGAAWTSLFAALLSWVAAVVSGAWEAVSSAASLLAAGVGLFATRRLLTKGRLTRCCWPAPAAGVASASGDPTAGRVAASTGMSFDDAASVVVRALKRRLKFAPPGRLTRALVLLPGAAVAGLSAELYKNRKKKKEKNHVH